MPVQGGVRGGYRAGWGTGQFVEAPLISAVDLPYPGGVRGFLCSISLSGKVEVPVPVSTYKIICWCVAPHCVGAAAASEILQV